MVEGYSLGQSVMRKETVETTSVNYKLHVTALQAHSLAKTSLQSPVQNLILAFFFCHNCPHSLQVTDREMSFKAEDFFMVMGLGCSNLR